ncbi:hypothetical protein AU467_15970 [Mesorhizobium loti]|uniref:Uncharacterized protein n=1 Tax=Rhizobium loti TaxID=381 RepID=A0A101KVI4_RHILI|nr:hypothetical protein AU467_15970 [Mesorhizobium loti]
MPPRENARQIPQRRKGARKDDRHARCVAHDRRRRVHGRRRPEARTLSDPAPTAPDRPAPNLATPGPTLEPRRRGLGFLGLSQNWPGLLMMAAGIILLLSMAVL